MHRARRTLATLTATVLTAGFINLTAPPAGAGGDARRHPHHHSHESPQVVLDWEGIAFRTIYPATPIPQGVPVMGFTSVAMYDAVRASEDRRHSSETAAVAQAAHDVLAAYNTAAVAQLDAALAATLAGVRDGRSEDRGIAIGKQAAAEMLASRVGDGFLDPTIHYSKTPGPGVWQPTPPATDMLVPWLGSLKPLVVRRLAHANGPDLLESKAYARDYDEVKRLGSATGSERTPEQTDTALFFNSNSATMVGDALIRYLEDNPLSLHRTARLFAQIHAAMTDSVIKCWQLKRDVGFWRPSQAIAGAETDGNPSTSTQAGWTPLIPNPPYSDYVSGHASLTAPAVAVIRRTLGEHTELELIWVGTTAPPNPTTRTYSHLSQIEHDAFNARIWSGLHFRRAMIDGYRIGHETARRVMSTLH